MLVYCSNCKKFVRVLAKCIKLHNMETNIIIDKENYIPYLDYENCEIEADWKYICDECNKTLSKTIDGLIEQHYITDIKTTNIKKNNNVYYITEVIHEYISEIYDKIMECHNIQNTKGVYDYLDYQILKSDEKNILNSIYTYKDKEKDFYDKEVIKKGIYKWIENTFNFQIPNEIKK